MALFVDDSWGVSKQGNEKYEDFLLTLNSVWDSINFTPVIENENRSITLLELGIQINNNGSLGIENYHFNKPTNSDRYLHFESHSF